MFREDLAGVTLSAGVEQHEAALRAPKGCVGNNNGCTVTPPWRSNSIRFIPPYAEAYWSCLPIGSPSRSISRVHACSQAFSSGRRRFSDGRKAR